MNRARRLAGRSRVLVICEYVVFRRADDGQRHHERAGSVAASDNRASFLRLHGLLTPRGFPVELSSVLFLRDVCASRETAEEESRLVHVENELDVQLFQLLPNLRYVLHHRLGVHVTSFPVQVDVLEAVAISEAMQSALACLELDSHLRRDLCSPGLDHVTTQNLILVFCTEATAIATATATVEPC